jgi:hypothetical protein
MAEWSNAAVSKTVVPQSRDRGFEPPSLRKAKANTAPVRRSILVFRVTEQNLFCEDQAKNKNTQFFIEKLDLLWLYRVPQKRSPKATPLHSIGLTPSYPPLPGERGKSMCNCLHQHPCKRSRDIRSHCSADHCFESQFCKVGFAAWNHCTNSPKLNCYRTEICKTT